MQSQFLKDRFAIAKDLQKQLRSHYEYVSIFARHAYGTSVRVTNDITSIDEMDSIMANEAGFVIKVFHQGYYSEYSCDDIKDLQADTVVNALNVNLNKTAKVNVAVLDDEPIVKSFTRENQKSLTDEQILEKLVALKDYFKAYDSRLVMVALISTKREINNFFISDNRQLDQYYTYTNMMTVLQASDGTNMQQIYKASYGVNDLDVYQDLESKKEQYAKLAIDMLKATPIQPGEYDVILDPSISGLLAHEAFGHGVEMDMFVKNRAQAANYIGKQVASPLVSMHDGAAATLSAASYFFDDDGVLAKDTLIIKDGILLDGISDVLTALQLNKKPSGNSRRESTRKKAYTRMTNTFFSPGNDKFEDMLASIKHGYYLCDTNNGMEDPKNWQLQCTANYGLEIIDGKFSGKIVAPVVMSGYVPDVLKSISMVGDTLEVEGAGMCGKGYKEWVYVADGGPVLKARVKLG